MKKDSDSPVEQLKKKLLSDKKSVWQVSDKEDRSGAEILADEYMEFLSSAKTERLACGLIVKTVEKAGYEELGAKVRAGGKYFFVNRKKGVILIHVGTEDIRKGFNLVASHIDSPRLDLKQNPLFEDGGIALFKTHYYGGIKKYHWLNTPLAIHGIVVRKDGTSVHVDVGEKPDDPVFLIPDLLIHLSRKSQEGKKLFEAYSGEHLNLMVGTEPYKPDAEKETKDSVKLNVLSILNARYGITESDFVSAELELVPAGRARRAGFDRSMIAGYGHDDRSCVFTSLKAFLAVRSPKRTCVAVFADKEEIGSEGVTALRSWVLTDILGRVVSGLVKDYDDTVLRQVLAKSSAISADVDGAMDPTFKEVNEARNNAAICRGVSINKYTGHAGKLGASDANAEYVGKIRKLFSDNGIVFQFTELGKVDEGGGGTVAKDLAKMGLEVIDCGPPVLGMHSPCELLSIMDLWQAFRAYRVFFEKMS